MDFAEEPEFLDRHTTADRCERRYSHTICLGRVFQIQNRTFTKAFRMTIVWKYRLDPSVRPGDFVGRMVKRESEKMLRKAKVKTGRVIAAKDNEVSAMFGIALDSATTDVGSKTLRPDTGAGRATKKQPAKRGRGRRPPPSKV